MYKAMILAGGLLLGAVHAMAGPPEPLRTAILAKAQQSGKDVLVAVTARGEIAAETAWLLSAQVVGSNRQAPLLLVLNPDEQGKMLRALGLQEASLPALIHYNRHGQEISRIIGALPSRLIKNPGNQDEGPN